MRKYADDQGIHLSKVVREGVDWFVQNHPRFALEHSSDEELNNAIIKMDREEKIKFLRERN